MNINQISIFLENKPTTLSELTNTFAEYNINMRAISLADSSDFGIARIIVDDPESAKQTLKNNDYIVSLTPVLLVEIADETGSLNKILGLFAKNDINLEYMYGFTGKTSGCAYMIMRCTDTDKAEKVLSENGIHLVGQSEISKI